MSTAAGASAAVAAAVASVTVAFVVVASLLIAVVVVVVLVVLIYQFQHEGTVEISRSLWFICRSCSCLCCLFCAFLFFGAKFPVEAAPPWLPLAPRLLLLLLSSLFRCILLFFLVVFLSFFWFSYSRSCLDGLGKIFGFCARAYRISSDLMSSHRDLFQLSIRDLNLFYILSQSLKISSIL